MLQVSQKLKKQTTVAFLCLLLCVSAVLLGACHWSAPFDPTATVIFTGGSEAEDINPVSATVETDAGSVNSWQIFEIGADASGAALGDSPSDAVRTGEDLPVILTGLNPGHYTIDFSLVSSDGKTEVNLWGDFTVK